MSEPSEEDLRFVRRFPERCCVEVSRAGESVPCDKTAVAVTADAEHQNWWPVCPYHTRGRQMVPLADLLKHLAE